MIREINTPLENNDMGMKYRPENNDTGMKYPPGK